MLDAVAERIALAVGLPPDPPGYAVPGLNDQAHDPLICLPCHRIKDPTVSADAGTLTLRISTTEADLSARSASTALVSDPLPGLSRVSSAC